MWVRDGLLIRSTLLRNESKSHGFVTAHMRRRDDTGHHCRKIALVFQGLNEKHKRTAKSASYIGRVPLLSREFCRPPTDAWP
jgi:hypothetical protein